MTEMEHCKYYNKHIDTIRAYISCLYELEDCCCGGLLHVMIDDGNIEDWHVNWTLEQCEAHPECEESEIGKLICKEFLKLSMEERRLVMEDAGNVVCYTLCCPDCDKCPIHNPDADFWR